MENQIEVMQRILESLVPVVSVMGVFAVFLSALTVIRRAVSDKIVHRVAMIGLPRSGKTTLIANLFFRLIVGEMSSRIKVTGEGTNTKITSLIEMIRSGKDTGPSTDRDVYSFRFEYIRFAQALIPLPRKYDVEVADFPGEYTENLVDQASTEMGIDTIEEELARIADRVDGDDLRDAVVGYYEERRKRRLSGDGKIPTKSGLYDRQFFTYVTSADAFIFVVDIDTVINGPDSIGVIEAKIFSSVVTVRDGTGGSAPRAMNKPAALVFTKSDTMSSTESLSMLRERRSEIFQYSTQSKSKIDDQFFNDMKGKILDEFRETISLMRVNFRRFDVFFHSSYSREQYFKDEELRLLRFILP